MAKEIKKGFVLYYDYREHLKLLSDDERGKLLMALLNYGEYGKEPNLYGAALMAFSFITSQMDRDAAKYAETCRKRSEAGKRGGRPPKANASEEEANAPPEKQGETKETNTPHGKQEKPKKANAFEEKQTKTKKADTDTDTDTGTDKDKDIIPPNPPRGTDTQERRFAEFWAEYPKKVGKKAAQSSWKKLKPDAELFDCIMQAVKTAKNSEQWNRENGRFIPNPSTWINQGRWDDELIPARTTEQDPQRRWPSFGEYSGNSETSGNEPTLSGFQMAAE